MFKPSMAVSVAPGFRVQWNDLQLGQGFHRELGCRADTAIMYTPSKEPAWTTTVEGGIDVITEAADFSKSISAGEWRASGAVVISCLPKQHSFTWAQAGHLV